MRVFVALLVLATVAVAQDSPWEVVFLPAEDDWIWTLSESVNTRGDAVGAYSEQSGGLDAWHAVLWKDGGYTKIAEVCGLPGGFTYSHATAINDVGQIGGYAVSGRQSDPDMRQVAVLWDLNSESFQSLHPEGLGFDNSRIGVVTNSGLALGDVINWGPDYPQRAYLWNLSAGTGRLLPIPADMGASNARALNESGMVAGWVMDTGWGDISRAAVWLAEGTFIDLHPQIRSLEPRMTWTRAFAVGDSGLVVGLGWNDDGTQGWGWTWEQDVGVTLLDRGDSGEALATGSNYRIIVGSAGDGDVGEERAAVWIDGILHELPALPGYANVSLWAVNSGGVATGSAVYKEHVYRWWLGSRAFLAVPRAEGDYDGDALKDKWELQGYEHDNGSHVDLPAMGANPLRKDLFVEVDAMVGHRPSPETLQPVIDAFKAHDIALHLHIDDDLTLDANLGTLDGLGRYQWDEFDALKTAHFAEELESAVRYCVFAHRLATLTDSGLARGEPSSDFIVSLGAFVEESGSTDPWMQAGTFMHELGHTLGLRHGGADVTNRKPNYLSVMNYDFQKQGLRIAGQDGHFDYSRAKLADLDETALDEGTGLGTATAGFQTLYRVVTIDPITFETTVVAVWSGDAQGSIDWDGDGAIDAATVAADINGNGAAENLIGHDDWAALDFEGGTVGYGVGIPPPPPPPETEVVEELTVEEAKLIPPPPVQGLAGRAGRSSVRISWTPVGPYGQGTYKVYRRSATAERELVAETQASLISDRPGRGTWFYVVTVTDSVGAESLNSEELELRVR